MRILYVTDAFAIWGGMERVLADKMNYLSSHNGLYIHLLTVNQGFHGIPFQLYSDVMHTDLQIRLHQQYKYHGIKRLLIRRKLLGILKSRLEGVIYEIKPDIIVCVKLDFVGLLLQVKGIIPLVVESHSLYLSEQIDRSGWLRRMHVYSFKKYICKADAVVALTEGDADEWRKINRNVFVIPNVVHLNESGKMCSCLETSVIFVGRFSSQKDIQSLLSIWKLVNKKYPNWQLSIYGDGELKDYYMPIIQGMDANIHVFSPTPAIMEKYLESSILILTSLFEPFGLVIPEAMSCGLPVVSFDCPYGPADIITDGVDGFLVKNRDINEFADRVCQLIEDKELRVQMGQNAIKTSQRFRAEVIMPKWKELFDSFVN